jgi:hypothetical protein
MRRDAHFQLTYRRLSTFGLIALVSCLLSFGTSDAVAKASTSKSLTQAQKLSKALKVCNKQPKKKRAACVKRANKKYVTHHAASPKPPTGSATPTTGPVTPPAAGPIAPAGPTLAQIQQQLCEHHCSQAQILNVTIRERGVPRLGTGVSQQSGGDNVPSDTWIFPLVVGYDELVQKSHYAPCPPSEPVCVEQLVTETETYHWTEKENAQLAHSGAWSFYLVTANATCEPAIASCPT